MCTNYRKIYNKDFGHDIYVPCGRCVSCLMDKSDLRAERIRYTGTKDSICYFVTLTYKNNFIPYIKRSDIKDCKDYFDNLKVRFPHRTLPDNMIIPVYRDYNYNYVRSRDRDGKRIICGKIIANDTPIDSRLVTRYLCDEIDNLYTLKNGDTDHTGISYLPDVQNFIKRLKINLHRRYKYDTSKEFFRFYQCGEYGPTSCRPHFHLLIWCSRSLAKSAVTSAVVKSWPFADRSRTRKYVEIAYDAASYVATYINRDVDLPKTFCEVAFKAKHTYSHNFGCDKFGKISNDLSQKILRGTMSYLEQRIVDNALTFVDRSYPKYYIGRLFPKFKGYCRFTCDEIRNIVLNPCQAFFKYASKLPDYSIDDYRRSCISLKNAAHRSGLDISIYAELYSRVWSSLMSTKLRKWYERITNYDDWESAYDNIVDFYGGFVDAPTLSGLFAKSVFCGDVNKFTCNIAHTQMQISRYFNKLKIKRLKFM